MHGDVLGRLADADVDVDRMHRHAGRLQAAEQKRLTPLVERRCTTGGGGLEASTSHQAGYVIVNPPSTGSVWPVT